MQYINMRPRGSQPLSWQAVGILLGLAVLLYMVQHWPREQQIVAHAIQPGDYELLERPSVGTLAYLGPIDELTFQPRQGASVLGAASEAEWSALLELQANDSKAFNAALIGNRCRELPNCAEVRILALGSGQLVQVEHGGRRWWVPGSALWVRRG